MIHKTQVPIAQRQALIAQEAREENPLQIHKAVILLPAPIVQAPQTQVILREHQAEAQAIAAQMMIKKNYNKILKHKKPYRDYSIRFFVAFWSFSKHKK